METPPLTNIQLGEFTLNLEHYLRKDYDDISLAVEEIPPVLEWINCELQSLTEQKLVKSQQIKEIESRVYFDLKGGRFSALYDATAKMTESALEKAVTLDDRVQTSHREYAVLAGWCLRLSNLKDIFEIKLDLLRSSEATRRKIFQQTERED